MAKHLAICLIFLYTEDDSGNCFTQTFPQKARQSLIQGYFITVCNLAPEEQLKNHCIADLGRPNTVWAVSSVHGQYHDLVKLHDALYPRIRPGDRVVYLGNYWGYGDHCADTIDELLTFRRLILSKKGMVPHDIVFLRGAQEEMLQKLMQIQFAPNPSDILLWMLGNGLSKTLYSYGLSPHDGIEACRHGTMGLTKWTGALRTAIRKHAGHEIFATHLQRACATKKDSPYPMLFVNSGLDYRKDLKEQGDNFWWGGEKFEAITEKYAPFEKVIRGYDPAHRGVHLNCVQATIDGGAGFGGSLVAAGFDQGGKVVDMLET